MIIKAYRKYISDRIFWDFLIRLSLYWKSLFKKISTQKKLLNSLNHVGGKEIKVLI